MPSPRHRPFRPALFACALLGGLFVWGQTAPEAIPALWAEGDYAAAWDAIVEARTVVPREPVWELYAALSLYYGLGVYRDALDARQHYARALLLGAPGARQAFLD
ncbi:MAG: hypothetical protein ACLFU2_13945, partial [Opitutales bacterium]